MVEVKSLSGNTRGMSPVHDINFKLQNGQIYGILGDENSGGSTLLSLLAGASLPLAGAVLLGGIDTVREPLKARRSVGYFPRAHHPSPDLTPLEYLLTVAECKGMEYNRAIRRVGELLEWASLEEKRSTLIRKLSTYDTRLLGIAQALLGNPEFLFLDEITRDLPSKEVQSIHQWLMELRGEKTVFLHSQDPSELRAICDRILLLRGGTLQEILLPDDAAWDTLDWKTTPKQESATSVPNKKPSRWTLLTRASNDYEVIDIDEKEDRR